MIHVGVLKVDIHIPQSRSLKEKRSVLLRIKDRVKNTFNVSISEVDNHDKWQLASFGIACIANDKKHIDALLCRVKHFIEKERAIMITDHHVEIL
jgi:uncharacterized protein YlxP (DUF503 family)